MPTRIEMLKQAGFSDDEIGDWAKTERQRMQEAGFTDGEIDDEFGVTRPPKEVPPAFTERLKQGWLYRVLGAAGEYARNYFGDEPLGFSPESQRQLGKFGIVGDLAAAAGGPVDALLRSVPAGIAGVGAGLGQLYEEGRNAALGPDPYAKGKAARDFAQLAQIAALLSGANGPTPGLRRTPVPKSANGPVIELPRTEDFRSAAASISATSASFQTEQKLHRLWTEYGIHPTEVADDALKDHSIADTMMSDPVSIPEVYVGANRAGKAASPQASAPSQAVEPGQSEQNHLPGPQPERDAMAATVSANGRTAPTDAEVDPFPSLSAAKTNRITSASETTYMYDPPSKTQRPFTDDYPNEARTDAQGRLLEDIEGRPLGAAFIAGRRFSGEADQPLSPADIRAAIKRVKLRFSTVPGIWLRPDVSGIYIPPNPGTRRTGDIFINKDLPDQELTMAHEFSHAMDYLVGNLSQKLTPAEVSELRDVYSALRTGSEDPPYRRQPENFNYFGNEVKDELLAEGMRAYMTNPNYFKTIAPKTAAKIRAAVNDHPRLKRAIQFNSLGAAGLIGAGADDRDEGRR